MPFQSSIILLRIIQTVKSPVGVQHNGKARCRQIYTKEMSRFCREIFAIRVIVMDQLLSMEWSVQMDLTKGELLTFVKVKIEAHLKLFVNPLIIFLIYPLTLQGDSGGPLTCDGKLVGLASFGLQCGYSLDFPGVFVDVYFYREWIEENWNFARTIRSSISIISLLTILRFLILS
jgi:hypothetical protein